MDLDTKCRLLLAIYYEYQKDIPDMSVINYESLNLDCLVFQIALDKLQNEGLITGAKLQFISGSPYPNAVVTDYIKMTRDGIEFVEEKILAN